MIQPKARSVSKPPAAASGPAGRTASRPVTKTSMITGRPVVKTSMITGRPVTKAPVSTSHPVTKTSLITGRPVVKTTMTAGRPVTHTSTVTRPGTHTAQTAHPGLHTRRTGTYPHRAATHPHRTATATHRTTTAPLRTTTHTTHPGGPARRPGTTHTSTTHKHVTGWPHHHGQRHYTHPGGAVTHQTVHGGHPGTSTVIVPTRTSMPTRTPISTGPSIPFGQTVSTGYGCSTPAPGASSTTTPRKPCHNCGKSTRGCTTLSRFAFNSSELKTSHKTQLRDLADRILKQNSNTVIATGHTDHTGTEDYNEALGERRAAAVVKELKKQMSLLKPGSQKLLFWKIDSKGETRPVSQTDAAANRRVSICVRKGSFIK